MRRNIVDAINLIQLPRAGEIRKKTIDQEIREINEKTIKPSVPEDARERLAYYSRIDEKSENLRKDIINNFFSDTRPYGGRELPLPVKQASVFNIQNYEGSKSASALNY